jgi:formylglycine-generating enzyme required for sulfatase activity
MKKLQRLYRLEMSGVETFSLTGVVPKAINELNINDARPHEAMGLSEVVCGSDVYDTSELYREMRYLSDCKIKMIAESQCATFRERLVAGRILNEIGDERVCSLAPEMVEVPARRVRLGLSPAEVDSVWRRYRHYGVRREWIAKESPQYIVDIDGFRLAKYCVTNFQYLQFLESSKRTAAPSSWRFGVYPKERGNHPVYTVTREDADAYISWINSELGESYRLPTEAEWEYAASGPEGWEFPWGNQFIADHCNTLESGIVDSTPVGIFPKGNSAFGIADMAGNVEEYVSGVYAAYAGGNYVRDDLMVSQGPSYSIARGGSFTRFRDLARTRRRHGYFRSGLYAIGFRLAADL